MLIRKSALENKNLLTAPMSVRGESRAGGPSYESYVFVYSGMEWQHTEAVNQTGSKLSGTGVNVELFSVCGVELIELHKDRTALFGVGLVAGTDGIAHIRSRWIITAFVRKHALKHEKLLASAMCMRFEI